MGTATPAETGGPDPARVRAALEQKNAQLRNTMQEISDLRVNIPPGQQAGVNLPPSATPTLAPPAGMQAAKSPSASGLGNLSASLNRSEEVTLRLADTATSINAVHTTPTPSSAGRSRRGGAGGAGNTMSPHNGGSTSPGPGLATSDDELWAITTSLEQDPSVKLMFEKHSVQLHQVGTEGSGGR